VRPPTYGQRNLGSSQANGAHVAADVFLPDCEPRARRHPQPRRARGAAPSPDHV